MSDLVGNPGVRPAAEDLTNDGTAAVRAPARTRRTGRPINKTPSLRVERALQREGYRILAGMDEVGRGALAGPVSVGVVVIDERCRTAPQGVRDSKLLTPAAREAMVPRVRKWASAYAVGHASAAEIDQIGIIAALRLAGTRALAALPVAPELVILDGNHDWLSDPSRVGLFADLPGAAGADSATVVVPPVRTMIKADLKCSSVAAASVLAKVERDGMLTQLHELYPHYAWATNKGYSAPEHLAALDAYGPCELHRRSWRRFVTDPPGGQELTDQDAAAMIAQEESA